MADSAHASSSLLTPSDGSSKTGSSLTSQSTSQGSVAGKPPAKDEGFSPIDIECQIQTERVTKSLDKAVYLTKLALCLPVLVKSKILSGILEPVHLDYVCYVYHQYEKPLTSHSLLNMAAVEDMQAGDKSLKHRLNPELSCMLHILNSYESLKPHVEKLTEKMKTDFVTRTNQGGGDVGINTSHAKKPPAGLAYLLKLEHFRDLMVVKMKTKAADQISDIMRTRRLEKSNDESLAKISEYTKTLKEEKEDMEEQMRYKTEMIAELKQQIAVSSHHAYMQRKKHILDSERQMVLAKRAHVVKYQMLKEEVNESQDNYEKTIYQNLATEKRMRDRRRKVETQLQSWLQKYDQEMRLKQVDLDDLTEQYEGEVDQVKELERQLAEQDIEYEKLMGEREEEYHQEMTKKMNEFIIEHAARVIQMAWRQTQSNRAEKAKLLKLKRKQEAERAAEARKAELEAKKQALEEKKQAAKEKKEANAAAKLAKKTDREPEGGKGQGKGGEEGQAEQGKKKDKEEKSD